MATRLRIRLEGSAPGLDIGGLSLGAFHDSLSWLLRALRRIGTSILTNAAGDEYYGAKGGRLAQHADSLDFVLLRVASNSPLDLFGEISQPAFPPAPLLAEHFTDLVADAFLDGVEHEKKGEPYSYLVRQYLKSMPPGVDRQLYVLERASGGDAREVSVNGMDLLPGQTKESPYLEELSGQVVGVGFEPGKVEVRFKVDGQTIVCGATTDQVDNALALRGEEVKAVILRATTNKLLRLKTADSPPFKVTEELRKERLYSKWDDLLRRLA